MNNSQSEAFEELNENTTEQENVRGVYSSKRKSVKKIKILTVVCCIISLLLMVSLLFLPIFEITIQQKGYYDPFGGFVIDDDVIAWGYEQVEAEPSYPNAVSTEKPQGATTETDTYGGSMLVSAVPVDELLGGYELQDGVVVITPSGTSPDGEEPSVKYFMTSNYSSLDEAISERNDTVIRILPKYVFSIADPQGDSYYTKSYLYSNKMTTRTIKTNVTYASEVFSFTQPLTVKGVLLELTFSLIAIIVIVLAVVVSCNLISKLTKAIAELRELDTATEQYCGEIKKADGVVKEKKFWKKRTVLSVILFMAVDIVLARYILTNVGVEAVTKYRAFASFSGVTIMALIPFVLFGAYIIANLLRKKKEAVLACQICDDDELGTDENDDSDDNDGVEENLTEIDDKKDSAPSSENQSLGFGESTF